MNLHPGSCMNMHLPQAGQLLSAPGVRVMPTWRIEKCPSYKLPTVHKVRYGQGNGLGEGRLTGMSHDFSATMHKSIIFAHLHAPCLLYCTSTGTSTLLVSYQTVLSLRFPDGIEKCGRAALHVRQRRFTRFPSFFINVSLDFLICMERFF